MSSSRTLAERAATQPEPLRSNGSRQARFIPCEELATYAAWSPQLLGRPAAEIKVQMQDLSRHSGAAGSVRHATAGLPSLQNFSRGLPSATAGAWPDTAQPGAASGGLALGMSTAAKHQDPTALRDADTAWREAVREELQEELLAEWQVAAEAELAEQVQAARQTGYQDGYRDGLVALESFKQGYAQQVTTQVGQLVVALDDALQAMERQLADSVARIATALARQVVRAELTLRPDLVALVAQEAMANLVKNARHITIALHPDDQALVAQHCSETLMAAGARLVADSDVARGGCLVESDMGGIDAQIASRWQVAAQTLGSDMPWQDRPAAAATAAAAPTRHPDPAPDALSP